MIEGNGGTLLPGLIDAHMRTFVEFFVMHPGSGVSTEPEMKGHSSAEGGWSRTAIIEARDIARLAATVFTEPRHLRRAYMLSGELDRGRCSPLASAEMCPGGCLNDEVS